MKTLWRAAAVLLALALTLAAGCGNGDSAMHQYNEPENGSIQSTGTNGDPGNTGNASEGDTNGGVPSPP